MDFQQITVYRADVFRLIPTLSYQYDLAFADPPYNLKEIESIPELVMTSTILKPNGLFILEHGAKYNFEGYSNFKENRKYGSVHFSIFMNP